jgi:hypothetical protein
MDQSKSSSRRMIFIGVAVVAVVAIVIVVVSVVMLGTTKKEDATTTLTPAKVTTIASKDDVQQNLSQLDSTLKQAQTDQAAAKAALKDGTSQIKVGN